MLPHKFTQTTKTDLSPCTKTKFFSNRRGRLVLRHNKNDIKLQNYCYISISSHWGSRKLSLWLHLFRCQKTEWHLVAFKRGFINTYLNPVSGCDFFSRSLCLFFPSSPFPTGGRMSTSRPPDPSSHSADLGAQYITATPAYAKSHHRYQHRLRQIDQILVFIVMNHWTDKTRTVKLCDCWAPTVSEICHRIRKQNAIDDHWS